MSEDARVRVEPVCPACDTPVALTSMLATQRVKCVKCGWEGMTRRSMPAVPEAYVPTILKPPVASLFTYDEVLAAVCPHCELGIEATYNIYMDMWGHGTSVVMPGGVSTRVFACVANDWRRRHPR